MAKKPKDSGMAAERAAIQKGRRMTREEARAENKRLLGEFLGEPLTLARKLRCLDCNDHEGGLRTGYTVAACRTALGTMWHCGKCLQPIANVAGGVAVMARE